MALIIALHAEPRAGKDTLAAELIKHFGFVRLSFAGPLYDEVSTAFGAPVGLLESGEWKTRPQKSLALLNCNNPEFRDLMVGKGFSLDEPLTSRCVLQNWGTEYRRHQDKEYWTDQMFHNLRLLYGCGPDGTADEDISVAITDTRVYKDADGAISYDEATILRDFGHIAGVDYRLVEVVRDGTETGDHSSDLRFPVELIHRTVYNTDTPTVMLNQLTAYLDDEKLEYK